MNWQVVSMVASCITLVCGIGIVICNIIVMRSRRNR
jgi:hypothetical protein